MWKTDFMYYAMESVGGSSRLLKIIFNSLNIYMFILYN